MRYRSAALTALVLATSSALIGSSAGAAPAAPTSTGIDVNCEGIGADTVTLTGDLARGGTAEIERGPLTVVGRPGFTGEDASGACRFSLGPFLSVQDVKFATDGLAQICEEQAAKTSVA